MLCEDYWLSNRWQEALQLWTTCQTGDVAFAQQLIEDGADYNWTDRNGETVLHMAARNDNPEMVKVLVQYVDPDIVNNNNQAPIHMAASKGHVDALKILIQAGCDCNFKTKFSGATPLHVACMNEKAEVVKVLLEGEAICNVTDAIGKTPDSYTSDDKILKLFSQHRHICTHGNEKAPSMQSSVSFSNSIAKTSRLISTSPNFPESKRQGSPPEESNYIEGVLGKAGGTTDYTVVEASSHSRHKKSRRHKRKQKKFTVSHGVDFSEEYKQRMQTNVFDRLTGNKNK